MSSAITMMLKSMGIDPEQMLKAVHEMGQKITEMHASQLRMEAMIKELYDEEFNAARTRK